MISATVGAPEKSVAVLPYENLSEDKENAFFADGVQAEILADLASVTDLKVISRTSVMHYRDAAKRGNLREIAAALGVSHVVEGSVQRAGKQVRVQAQLIDARNDTHRWAEHYDRPLGDVFALQSEIAERIATGLRAKLSPRELAAIEARPTDDLVAYDLYLQARELVFSFTETADMHETLLRAVRLLDEATRRDGRFALAWCLAARAHDQLYIDRYDPSPPQRLTLQEAAVSTALSLRPDLGEVHLARAAGDTAGTQTTMERAREGVELAVQRQPDDPVALAMLGTIDAGLGHKEAALRAGRRAVQMLPVSVDALDGPLPETMLALICTWTGESDEAMQHLLVLVKTPGGPEYGQLHDHPAWASLRVRLDYQTTLKELDPHWEPSEFPH